MFGRSFLLSTLKKLFEGSAKLFKGIAIATDPALRRCVD
jgi:hypothetical protein